MAATKLDVGGYKLAAEISGEGSPTVVFVSGGGDDGEPWDAVISALRSSTSILTYARAGIGDSETPDDAGPRSVGAAAEELRRLLVATDAPGPFVLVGHSLGALIALIFTAQWPQELAGLVLVDPTDIHLNLDVEDSEPWLPFSLAELDERWQRKHRALAAELGAVHKTARLGGHYVQKDDPAIVADAIDDLIQAARQP